ncbi:MAG: T9SS type A sorting domain-containing protein [Candidatus Delongbacteria bacterium]|nr:T9SS type A sorting domain-containing protein [Candidatus Delongbacteria bacterium]
MNRRQFFKGLGVAGVSSLLPLPVMRTVLAKSGGRETDTCWLTPQETAGPFYFNANLIREDIRTDVDTGVYHDGLPLRMNISVVDEDCTPIPDVIVDVWHADKDGLYSGYVQQGGSTVGQDFMRGIQLTDSAGNCSFITSYPGWYPGRANHVHFKVRLDSTTYVTSQFAFPDAVNDEVHVTPLYAARGVNPTTNSLDSIFQSPEPEHELMDVVSDGDGGYTGSYTIGIAGATAVLREAEYTPDRFWLKPNYPNPFNPSTTLVFNLPTSSTVRLVVFDLAGREVARLAEGQLPAGEHRRTFDGSGLPSGFYFCKLVAGTFSDMQEMLLVK